MTNRIAELTAAAAAQRIGAGAVLLLPMGSLETHGPHAPMGDHLLAAAIADRIAAAAGPDTLVLPALPFGVEDVFAGIPGAIALPAATFAATLEAMLACLHRGGARRVLILNGHGGSIPAIEAAQRGARDRLGLLVPALHLWREAAVWQSELGGATAALGHGGDPVWSVALHLLPGLCRPEAAIPAPAPLAFMDLRVVGFGAVACGGATFGVPATVAETAPTGVASADPRTGSAAHGAHIVDRLVAAGAAMVTHLAGAHA